VSKQMQNKVCVITGGAGSIGSAAAKLLLQEGAKVTSVPVWSEIRAHVRANGLTTAARTAASTPSRAADETLIPSARQRKPVRRASKSGTAMLLEDGDRSLKRFRGAPAFLRRPTHGRLRHGGWPRYRRTSAPPRSCEGWNAFIPESQRPWMR